MEIIDQNDRVIIVNENNHSEVINVNDGKLEYNPSIRDDMYKYACENSEYESTLDKKSQIKWPITFKSTHHLEDTLWRPALDAIKKEVNNDLAHEIFNTEMSKNISPAEISITELWELESNGSVHLKKIKYNGKEYTVC